MDGREQLAWTHPRDVPECVLEHALLNRDLRGGIQVLEAAAAADPEMRAGRRDACGTRGVKLGHARKLIAGLAAKHFDRDPLADQRAFDEDSLAVDAGDAAAFLIERGDDDGVHDFGRSKTAAVVVAASLFARSRDMERRGRMNSALRRPLSHCTGSRSRCRVTPALRGRIASCKSSRSTPRPMFAPSRSATARIGRSALKTPGNATRNCCYRRFGRCLPRRAWISPRSTGSLSAPDPARSRACALPAAWRRDLRSAQ